MEQRQSLSEFLTKSALSIGIQIAPDQLRQCIQYLNELKSWNKTTNLTSITDDREIITKHFLDSIAALNVAHFPNGALLLDVGTGAGFPGIPLKIMRSDLRVVLIEPSKKKCSFLRYVVGLLRLEQVEIYEGSLESFCNMFNGRERASHIMARGIRYEFILYLSKTIRVNGGHIIFFFSSSIDQHQ